MKKSACHNVGRPKSPEKTRAILAAAEDHFMRLGFELTSMDAVAKAANVSKLTIYSHFADKDALFKAVIKRKCETYTMQHDFTAMADMQPRKVLEQIAVNFIHLALSPQAICMHRVVQAESVRHPKIAELFYEAGPEPVKNCMSNLFSVWHEKKVMQFSDTHKAVEHFFCLIKGDAHVKMLLNLQKKPSDAAIKIHVDSCLELFFAGYGV